MFFYPLNKNKAQIILASGSPRRREILELLGLSFIVVEGGIDETPLVGESPTDLVQRLSRAKAEAVADTLLLSQVPVIIIAADTVVVLENEILGKPKNPSEATYMLKQLRQQPHWVYSGITVFYLQYKSPNLKIEQAKLITRCHQNKVWMRAYTDAEIADYVASGDPLDKAGAYGIQNKLFAPVAHLEGCFTSVMGLPLHELVVALRQFGLSLPDVGMLCTQYTGYPCCQLTSEVSKTSEVFLKVLK